MCGYLPRNRDIKGGGPQEARRAVPVIQGDERSSHTRGGLLTIRQRPVDKRGGGSARYPSLPPALPTAAAIDGAGDLGRVHALGGGGGGGVGTGGTRAAAAAARRGGVGAWVLLLLLLLLVGVGGGGGGRRELLLLLLVVLLLLLGGRRRVACVCWLCVERNDDECPCCLISRPLPSPPHSLPHSLPPSLPPSSCSP